MKKSIIKLYFDGLVVLVGAIVINVIVKNLAITTWFEFIPRISSQGLVEAISSESIYSLLFLFVMYPLLLGILVRVSYKY